MEKRTLTAAALTVVFLLGTALASFAANTFLTPALWDVDGGFTLRQSNGFTVALHLKQDGVGLRGTATHSGGGDLNGTVTGTQQGDTISMRIAWEGGQVGVYSGHIFPRGEIKGITYSERQPSQKATWTSDQGLKRLPEANAAGNAPTPPPRAKDVPSRGPIKHSGKPAPAGNAPTPPPIPQGGVK